MGGLFWSKRSTTSHPYGFVAHQEVDVLDGGIAINCGGGCGVALVIPPIFGGSVGGGDEYC